MLVAVLALVSSVAAEAPTSIHRVSGKVVDARGEPWAGATVLVAEPGLEIMTDLDGIWSVTLPAGTYTFKVFADGTALTRLGGVGVHADVTGLDALLRPAASDELYVVEADPDRTRDAVLLEVRRNAATVSDSVGAQAIARGTDKNAGDAVKRVPGVSVVGERYVYVRGMGERYNTTTLNGQTLPSPEPKKRVVPFNILPSNLLRDITVIKTPTPDMDGDTVGGRVELTTRDYPETFTAQASVSGGWNSLVTLQDVPTYTGGRTDWLGVDDGTRALPVAPGPTYDELLTLTDDQLARYVSNWSNDWRTTTMRAPPAHGANVGAGGTFYAGEQKFGWVAALTYDRSFKDLEETVAFHTRRTDLESGETTYAPTSTLAQRTTSSNALWGGLANLAWRPHPLHEIKVKTLATRRGENEVRTYLEENDSAELFDATRLRWTEQEVRSVVVEGGHDLRVVRLSWDASLGRATMNEPDRREYIYATANSSVPTDGSAIPLTWFDQSGFRFFNALTDDERSARIDLRVPVGIQAARDSSLRVGGRLRDKSRTFDARTFAFDVDADLDDATRSQSPEVLFGPDSVAAGNVAVSDTSRPNDSYDGIQRIVAGYAMGDLTATSRLRVVAGARVEWTYQDFQTGAYIDDLSTPTEFVVKDYLDVLPSAVATYKLGDATNLRLAAFRSIARPDYFELVPFRFTNYYKNVTQTGNPALERTRVLNADLRLETFPAPESVMAVTAFAKSLRDPIETVYVSDAASGQTNLEKPYNIPSGQVLGLELEARDGAVRISPALAGLEYGVNLSLIHSAVSFDGATLESEGTVVNVNELERPLAGQSPVVVNTTLAYTQDAVGFGAQAQANLTGRRLVTVGANGLPSAYEEAYATVDLALQQRLGAHASVSLKGTNLLDPARRTTQEGLTSLTYHLGRSLSASLTGSF